jgi:hypothetical protein
LLYISRFKIQKPFYVASKPYTDLFLPQFKTKDQKKREN